MVFIFLICAPLLLLALLLRLRRGALFDSKYVTGSLGVLFESYRRECFAFELVQLLRRSAISLTIGQLINERQLMFVVLTSLCA